MCHGPETMNLIGPIIAEKIGAKFDGIQAFPSRGMYMQFTCHDTGGTFLAASAVEASNKITAMRKAMAEAAEKQNAL